MGLIGGHIIKNMQNKHDFKVKLGDQVQLQFVPDEGRDRLNSQIIGHVPGKSLIINAPRIDGKLPIFREHQHFIVRMLQGSRLYGFESEILKYYTIPYPHIHLSLPKQIESKQVRNSQRVNTEMTVAVQQGDSSKTRNVTMLNTSATGSLLQSTTALGETGDNLMISLELVISSIQKYLRIPAIIRNITEPTDDNNYYRYGVQFTELDDEQKLIVNAYVNEQIVTQLEE